MNQNPLFLCGFPRSGTTLLRSIISAHSNIHLANNDDLLVAFMRAGLSPFSLIGTKEFDLLTSQASNIADFDSFLDTISAPIMEEIRSSLPLLGWSVFENLIKNANSNKSIWGSKTHDYIWLHKLLIPQYSQLKFIIIVRDPRSVVLSKYIKYLASSKSVLVNTTNFTPNEVLYEKAREYFIRASHQWQAWHHKLNDVKKNIPHNQILIIKYEDFLTNPQKTLLQVFSTINVLFEEEILNVEKRLNDQVLSNDKTAFAHKNLTKPITLENKEKWLELDPRLISIVEHICTKSMNDFEYVLTQQKSFWKNIYFNNYLDLRYKVRSREIEILENYSKYNSKLK